MEVMMIPSPAVDFNFDSASSSPCIKSSPSRPNLFGNCFFSTPTSPTRTFSSFFRHFNNSPGELKPGTPGTNHNHDDGNDFEFDFICQLDRTSLPFADELFDGGKIKPSKPPPNGLNDSLKLAVHAKNWRETVSTRNKKCGFEPLAAAIERSRNSRENQDERKVKEGGRERTYSSSASGRKQRGIRSLSPFRVGERYRQCSNSSTSTTSKASSSRKWSLRDFWTFWSATEGSNKEELKKYSVLKKSSGEDVKESSFRSTESSGGRGSVSRRRRGGRAVSAHERHYAAKKAEEEEMRKKTVLPYKHGLFGCLGFDFNPAANDISRGLGSLTRG